MKIKVLSAKTAMATGVYYLAIVVLLALVGVIVVKLVFWPPCSITTRNECVVDGWSVAGLAATILGVAAALLTLLGAFAVAAWWTNLNQRVDELVNEKVDAQMKERVDQILGFAASRNKKSE